MARDNFQHLFAQRDASTPRRATAPTTTTTASSNAASLRQPASVNQSNSSSNRKFDDVDVGGNENSHLSSSSLPSPSYPPAAAASSSSSLDESTRANNTTRSPTAMKSAAPDNYIHSSDDATDIYFDSFVGETTTPIATTTKNTDCVVNTSTTPNKNSDSLLVGFVSLPSPPPAHNNNTFTEQSPTPISRTSATHPPATATAAATRPGTESIQYISSRIKTFGGTIGSTLLSSQPLWRDAHCNHFNNNSNNNNNNEAPSTLDEADRLRRELEARDREQSVKGRSATAAAATKNSTTLTKNTKTAATTTGQPSHVEAHDNTQSNTINNNANTITTTTSTTTTHENHNHNHDTHANNHDHDVKDAIQKEEKELLLNIQSIKLAQMLQDQEDQMEMERVKKEALKISQRYDVLVKFAEGHEGGRYEEFIEFLLLDGGGGGGGVGGWNNATDDEGGGAEENQDYNSLLFEDFYDPNSEYLKLWNDNYAALGLSGYASSTIVVEESAFVPKGAEETSTDLDPWDMVYFQNEKVNPSSDYGGRMHQFHPSPHQEQQQQQQQYQPPLSTFRDQLRDRTVSESDRIKKQISQVDKQKLKQQIGTQFGSAVNALSTVSSLALKPLRDLQLAEKLNAMNLDMEEEEAKKEMAMEKRMEEDKRDLEEMMRLKNECEERCLETTREHLVEFVKERPNANYHEWIEDLHPENAHDGALLKGLGKTIDHRFFVEESDHRRLWNDHLLTFVDTTSSVDGSTSKGRMYVPARVKQNDDNGGMVVAADLLSGSSDHWNGTEAWITNAHEAGDDDGGSKHNYVKDVDVPKDKTHTLNHSDLIAFD